MRTERHVSRAVVRSRAFFSGSPPGADSLLARRGRHSAHSNLGVQPIANVLRPLYFNASGLRIFQHPFTPSLPRPLSVLSGLHLIPTDVLSADKLVEHCVAWSRGEYLSANLASQPPWTSSWKSLTPFSSTAYIPPSSPLPHLQHGHRQPRMRCLPRSRVCGRVQH